MNLLEIKDVTKRYGTFTALENINLAIEKGKIIGLLGPNGSGKSTLIKLIKGLLSAQSGEILFNGEKIGIETHAHISYLPERTYLDSSLRVREVLVYFKDFYKDFDESKARVLLNNLNIDINAKLENLSKGTKEKVQLILVMSRKSDLYILDEPIAGVDPAARDYILDFIISNYNPEATIIISTHLISDIERVLDDVIFINNGHVILHDTADNIRAQYGTSIDGAFREVFKCSRNFLNMI